MDADAVVVGAGFGGLAAGACLAKAGKQVVVIERQQGVGGNGHAFRRGAYTFDPAIHVTARGFGIDFLEVFMQSLGIAERVELMTADVNSAVRIAGSRFTLPTGVAAVTEYLCEQFPDDADGVAAFMRACVQVTRESQTPPTRIAPADYAAAMAEFPALFKYRMATVADVLDEFLDDPQAKAVCGAQWPYLGLPPSRQSFMTYSGAWMALLEPGPVYPRGSFQALADAIAEVITEHGGQLLLGISVTAITADGDGVSGVTLEDGQTISAPVVVSNADARLTFEQLLGAEHVPESLRRRLGRMKPSLSAFVLYTATTLDPSAFGLAHENFIYRHWDHDESYRELLSGGIGGMWLSVPTAHDADLAPAGEHIVVFGSLMPFDIGEPWKTAKPRYTELLLAELETHMPGIRDATTFLDSASPSTFHDYTLASSGGAYGWENTPNQVQPKRLSNRTPVAGLWLAGHWTNPGTGSIRCLFSGAQTAGAILGQDDAFAFLSSLAA